LLIRKKGTPLLGTGRISYYVYMNKEELRALYRQIRLRMSKGEVSSKSRIISRKLLNDLTWSKYKKVCVFKPIAQLNEVDTRGIVSRLEAQGIKVTKLSSQKQTEVPNEKFDLILVPCLAYDAFNHRLGWGGGWYDKFLASQPQAVKIGLCFSSGFARGGLPIGPYDVKLDLIVTDEKV